MKVRKTKLKLKSGVFKIIKILGIILVLLLIIYIWYFKQIKKIEKLGYSKIASEKIFFDKDNKDYIMTVKDNKTLNAALESDYYKEKYLKNYVKITFVKQKHLIENINKLLDKGYSNSDVSIIITHGNDNDVTEFAKRERVKYLEEFYEYSFAKIKYYDRYLKYTDETGEDERTSIIHVNLNMDKVEYEDAIEINKFSYDMLINKYNFVNEKFEPDDLISIPKEYSDEKMMANRVAVNALVQLIESAKIDGYEIEINSAYRSYQDQIDIIEFYRKWYGDNYVNNYVARAGFSEHQSGLAFDLGSSTSKTFLQSKEYKWMQENAHKYGFIIRFYKKVESITGYKSEPWHYRYVGKEIATYIHDHDISFEEYYAMFLDK